MSSSSSSSSSIKRRESKLNDNSLSYSNANSLIYSKLAELDLVKSSDEICKDFLKECKIKSSQYIISDKEKEDALRQLESAYLIKADSDYIKQLFLNKISSNNDLRKQFMNDLQAWKLLLSNRSTRYNKRIELEKSISFHQNVYDGILKTKIDAQEKLKIVEENTKMIIDAEVDATNDFKMKFNSVVEDVKSKFDVNTNDANDRDNENLELKSKLENLKKHVSLQKQHNDQELYTKTLYQQLYDAKLAQLNELKLEFDRKIQKNVAIIDNLENIACDYRKQKIEYDDKFNEFIKSNNNLLLIIGKNNRDKDEISQLFKKLDVEVKKLEKDIQEIESELCQYATNLQKHQSDIQVLNENAKLAEKKCRQIQEIRSKSIKTERSITTSSSSSSSSSSSRYVTAAGGESPSVSPIKSTSNVTVSDTDNIDIHNVIE